MTTDPRGFRRRHDLVCLGASLAVCLSVLTGSEAWSQQVNPRTQPTPALQYFGGGANSYVVRAPQTAAARPQSIVTPGGKPFQHIDRGPVLSPYLSLDLIESSTAIPNYYSFVLPQQQQRAQNEAQTRELERLRRQLRVATAQRGGMPTPQRGMPTTGTSSQFMNLGNYFPAVSRQ